MSSTTSSAGPSRPSEASPTEASFDPRLPLEQAHTIPKTWYTDATHFERERRAIFSQSWQFVGRSEQVSQPGDYLTAELVGEPLLVIRGDDGTLRAFYNVCRHRAAPILTDPCGHATKLRCPYHGWTYDRAGQLRGTPEFEGVCNFDKSANGLIPVAVAEWGPFVFVHLQSQPSPPPASRLNEFLAPLPEWVASREAFTGLRWAARTTYDLRCNWKVYVDNYLDGGYHVNSVHPGLADVLDYSTYRTTTYRHTSLQSSGMKPGSGDTGRTRTGTEAAYWWVYPNFMLNLYSGIMDTNWVVPTGPQSCRVVFDFYFRDQSEEFQRASIVVAEQVQAEDIRICEQVQRGLASSAFHTGRFSVRRENGGYHFHQLLAEYLAAHNHTHQ